MRQAQSIAILAAAVVGFAAPSQTAWAEQPSQVLVVNPVTLNPAVPNPVTIVNPPNAAPSTVTVANPVAPADIAKALGVGKPFSISQACESHGSFCTLDFPAPANQRTLVEYIALFCSSNNAGFPLPPIAITANLIRPSNAVGFPIDQQFGINQPAVAPGDATLSFAQFTRLYVDTGSTLELAVVSGNTSTMSCNFGVSGQNIDAP